MRSYASVWSIFHLFFVALVGAFSPASATTFTTEVPGTSLTLPSAYPEAGGVAIVMVGVNGNSYFQFSDPDGAFVGFQNRGTPTAFRGNPFTINNPISLNCGFSSCADYFGGSIAEVHIRFSAYDGDTQPGGFDEDDITLRLNGFDVGSWSGLTTEATNTAGTTSFGFGTGFGNRTFDTGWFSSTNSALLANILSTGQTSTQVFDDDPNDNYWDFTRGNSLGNPDIVTVAPGYTIEKTSDVPTFAQVGDEVEYSYVVTNIGSVPINDLEVSDDKIASVTCDKTTIADAEVSAADGGIADFATCTGLYEITQEDFDAGEVTNIAKAIGIPEFGSLGELTDTLTVTGPVIAPAIELTKETTRTEFGAVGSSVPYTFTVENTGDATLTDIVVTDPLIPSLSCEIASLLPDASDSCTANYTVLQTDIDAFATSGTELANTATVNADAPQSMTVFDSDTETIPGRTPSVAMFLAKDAVTADYDEVGDTVQFNITIKNTGTVTYPAAPTVTDVLTSGATCPVGPVAPGASIVCSADYVIQQGDIDIGEVLNEASATITVGALTAFDEDTATVPAVRTSGLTLDKSLASGSPINFDATNVGLTYDYVLTNTGNVTLNAPAVTDDRVAVNCIDTTIAPQTSITCTSAVYSTTQDDLNDGGVTNIASATATEAVTGTSVTSGTDSVTVPALEVAAMTLVKTAPTVLAADFAVGETVTYTFNVTNSGNVDLNNQIRIRDDKIGNFTCSRDDLLVGDSVECTADYVLTTDDINAGVVVNVATAKSGSVTSDQVTATIAPVLTPAISLEKTSTTASIAALTDSVDYLFKVTNTGDTQILLASQPITIDDSLLDAAADCSAQPATLNPGDFFNCTGTYSSVTQDELDAGKVVNTATASFDFTQGGVTVPVESAASTAEVPVVQTVDFTLDKSGPATYALVNDSLSYAFDLENTGTVTIETLTVTDPLIPALSCTFTDVAPLATRSCSGSYAADQDDIDVESIVNVATATAETALNADVVKTDTHTATLVPASQTKSVSIDKVADVATFDAVGDVITYTMKVTSTGLQTLTNVEVTDILDPTYSCVIPTLAPGEENSDCRFSHTVTQGDIDAGSVDNTATADSAEITAATDSEMVTGPTRIASFEFEKSDDGDFAAKDDVVTFGFEVENTGNTTLTNLVITDPFYGTPFTCTITTLAPSATDTSCSVAYTVTQDDVDAGSITNTATMTVDAPAGVGDPADQTSTVIVDGPAEDASIEIVKTATDNVYSNLPDSEVFTFEVTNTGNVTLVGLTLTDSDLGFSCALDDLAPLASTTTCTGGAVLTATKTITQDEIDLGSYTNTATVTGESAGLATSVSDDGVVTISGPTQLPAISLLKEEVLGTTFDTWGQIVPYTYTITNTGNITLTGTFTVTDDKIATVTCPDTPTAGLAIGATHVCTGDYEVTLEDLDRGFITNNAEATTSQAVIPQTLGGAGIVSVDSGSVSETINASQLPALTLDKHVLSTSLASYGAVDDEVTFEYVVTNSGNVTTTADITITDDQIPGTHTCSTDLIEPGESVTCTLVWTADLPALNAGEVTNTASATTVFDGGNISSPTDTATVTAIQNPSLAIDKEFLSTDNPGTFNIGDMLSYSFTISNDGNVTVSAPFTLDDNLTSPVCASVPATLAPDDSFVCSAIYSVTKNDLDLGASTNVVSVTGTFGGDDVTSPSDTAVYPTNADPALNMTKTVISGADFAAVGDPVVYRFTLTNTGNVGLSSDIYINDALLDPAPLLCRDATTLGTALDAATLTSPAGVYTCDFTYNVTQDDLDNAEIVNNATAETVYAAIGETPTAVVSPNATATVGADDTPLLSVAKTVIAGDNPASLGNELTYQITVTNSGNQTLSGVTVADPLIPVLTCLVDGAAAPANVILAPNDTMICTGDYTVTQDDLDAVPADGSNSTLPNTADARGADPQGDTVTGTISHTHPLDDPAPAVELVKTITPEPGPDNAFSAVGQAITFVLSVENKGNVTLQSTVVTDDRATTPASCTLGPLEPGEIDTSCVVEYIVTQDDFDAVNNSGSSDFGGFLNTGTATSTPINPDAGTVSDSGEIFAKGPDHEPEFRLVKTADLESFDTFGETITYTYTIANTGNITLFDQPVIDDDKIGEFDCGTMPATGLLPEEFITCTATYNVTQDDIDAGFVTNIATVTSDEVTVPAEATETVDADRTPAVTMTKIANPDTDAEAGETVTYTYTVTNSGNVTLSNIALVDLHTSTAGTVTQTIAGDLLITDADEQDNSVDATADGGWDSLGPNDVVTFTSTYVVTQDDIDAQDTIENTVTLTSQSPSGTTPPTDEVTEVVTPEAADPELTVLKIADTSDLSDPPAAGDQVTFEITVTNTGNQTLDTIVLTDTFIQTDGTTLALDNGPTLTGGDTDDDGILLVDEVWTYSADYEITQDDIDAGGVSNSVLVTAVNPQDDDVEDISDEGTPADGDSNATVVQFPAEPSILGTKTITSTTTDLGGIVVFEITAQNTGNVTLTDVGIASDTLLRADGTVLTLASQPVFTGATLGSGAGVLIPTETATYLATYILVQDDIDAGGITNTATVTGTPPVGSAVTDISDSGQDGNPNTGDEITSLVIEAEPSIELDKRLATGQNPTYSVLNETVNFEFEITNTGNITLSGPFTVTDALITDQGGSVSCPVEVLAPLESLICEGAYNVTQDDLDNGSFDNAASATDGVSEADDLITVNALQLPEMKIDKVAEDVPAEDFVIGAEVTYTYTVTNIGNVTITEPIVVTDNLINAAGITCDDFPTAGVAPNATYQCEGVYTVTATDVDLQAVTNLASASDGSTETPLTSETIPDRGVPSLTITKTAEDGASFAEVGDEIDYVFTVENSGTQSFVRPIVVYDDKLGEITCLTPTSTNDFRSGETAECVGTHIVTQDDLDAGEVVNQAYAQTEFGSDDTPVTSAPVTETVDATLNPGLSLEKLVTSDAITAVGQSIDYLLVATNTGNQTLTNVVIEDPAIDGFTCEIATLLRDESLTCTGSYIVTQDDVDTGTFTNTATTTGVTPQGTGLDDVTDTVITDMPNVSGDLVLTKTATPTPFGPVGTTLTYLFAVENQSNVTINDLTVTDVMDPSFECEILSIAPNSTDNSCSYSITVTQDHVDAGEIENTGSVEGTDARGNSVSDDDTIVTEGPDRLPSIEATKVVLPSASAVGSVVTYQLSVENTGNVTVDLDAPVDTMERLNGDTVTLDAPFALVASTDTDSDGRLDVGETWIYSAEYTLTQTDLNVGGVSNVVSIAGIGANDGPVSDDSDDGIDSDGNTDDDPTLFEIAQEPSLIVTKAVQSSTGMAADDVVTFVISALNSGNVDLNDLNITDTLRRSDGTLLVPDAPVVVDVPAVLSPGEIAQWTVSYTLTQDDVDAGGIYNSAVVGGTDIDDITISDTSADDDTLDGNLDDDVTVFSIAPDPAFEVIKTTTSIPTVAGESAVFNIEVTNTGNVTLSELALIDTLSNFDGDILTPVTVEFVEADLGSDEGILQLAEVATYTATYTLTQTDVDSGGLSNTVAAAVETPLGGTLNDVSDDGGSGQDDPTLAPITAAPSFDIIKTATDPYPLFPTVDQVTFTITVQNTGNVTQTGIQVLDDLAAFAAPATVLSTDYPVSISASGFGDGTANAAYDGVTITETLSGDAVLAPDATGTIEITMVYSTATGQPAEANIGSVTSDQLGMATSDSAVVSFVDTDGDGVPDNLESDTEDRDGDGIVDRLDYDPTGYFYCEENGQILSGGSVSVSGNGFTQTGVGVTGSINIIQDGSNGYFQFFATAAGTYTVAVTYPPAGIASTDRISLGSVDATSLLPSNPASLGSNEFGATGVLADFTAAGNPFYTTFVIEAGDPAILNNNIPLQHCASVTNVLATKTADRTSAVFGETVNFTLTFTNNTSLTYSDATFVDLLPAGMLYTPDSARVDGVAVEPTVTARRLEWDGELAPAQTVTITLAARVVEDANLGTLINRTWFEDEDGAQVSNTATAEITIEAEHVFDCSDVIGKVFDDRNGNGYQDAPYRPVTDDTIYDGGKFAPLPEAEDYAEPGLAGVRLVAPDGTTITTDEFGRYSVPCAALPQSIGSNFILKLDTRSLPTGYRVTTENPRVERLTAGKFAKMNFGASIGNVVDIDLTATAFVAGQSTPSRALIDGLDGALTQIQDRPSTLRLSYVRQAQETAISAQARLNAVEREIKRLWRGRGQYKLIIEKTIKRAR